MVKLICFMKVAVGRCGRKLTTPESVTNGIGPECIKLINKNRYEKLIKIGDPKTQEYVIQNPQYERKAGPMFLTTKFTLSNDPQDALAFCNLKDAEILKEELESNKSDNFILKGLKIYPRVH